MALVLHEKKEKKMGMGGSNSQHGGKEEEEINSANKWEAWDSNPQPPAMRERKKRDVRCGDRTHDLSAEERGVIIRK